MSKSPIKFRWVKHPKKLRPEIEKYEGKLLVAVHALAGMWGLSVQNAARAGAKWEDRTGNARSGLFFAVDGFGLPPLVGRLASADAMALKTDTATVAGAPQRLVITLGHTVFYGKHLELNGKYAIVMSTLESNLSRLEAMLRELLR